LDEIGVDVSGARPGNATKAIAHGGLFSGQKARDKYVVLVRSCSRRIDRIVNADLIDSQEVS
jgi:hypothetical protein